MLCSLTCVSNDDDVEVLFARSEGCITTNYSTATALGQVDGSRMTRAAQQDVGCCVSTRVSNDGDVMVRFIQSNPATRQ